MYVGPLSSVSLWISLAVGTEFQGMQLTEKAAVASLGSESGNLAASLLTKLVKRKA